MIRRFSLLLVFGVPLLLFAQQSAMKSSEDAPAYHPPISGPKVYQAYCAVCHGADGKGNGPAAATLKTWPADLTTIAKRNDGTFPTLHVAEKIEGDNMVAAHGSREMPLWGPVFRSVAHGHSDSARVRMENLLTYLESIQEK